VCSSDLVGASHVIVGHSERRQYFNETNTACSLKNKSSVAAGLTVLYCVGETLEERETEQHWAVIEKQIEEGLTGITSEEMHKIVIAYEPVWAIGTGKTASSAQAQEVHAFIRSLLNKKFGEPVAEATRILYGGSVKPDNAAELFAQPDIDGGLIGGASLKARDFFEIVKAAG
jgi:triosephosphate isomerase